MYQLFINGVEADLAEDKISLKFNSNLLTDISKIISNNSYTIKLPFSTTNCRIIECSHIPSAVSKFPYVIHSGTLIKDGISIVEDADVIILSVGQDGIDIALRWGNVRNVSPLKNLSLRDLKYTTDEYVVWEKGENSRTFPLIEYGFREDDTEVWYHPAVSVKWVLDKIASSVGITFNLPSDRTKELNEMFLPLTDRNDSDIQSNANSYTLYPNGFDQLAFFRMLKFTQRHSGEQYFTLKNPNTIQAKNHKVTLEVNGFITFIVDVNGKNGAPNTKSYQIEMEIRRMKANDAGDVKIAIPADVEHISGNRYKYSFNFNECSVDLEPNEEVIFNLIDAYTVGLDCFTVSVIIGESGRLDLTGRYPEIKLGDKYYFVPNLPDIKQIDFLKAVSNMLGLFAIASDSGTITLVSFDTLERNKSRATDWSKLVVHKYGQNEPLPNKMEYTLPDMARINKFMYKKDKESSNDEAVIMIDNLTLEYERNAVELPFASSGSRKGMAYIPLYEYKDNKAEARSVEPRILRYQGYKGVFTGLSWDTLLNKYYNNYKHLVTNAKVIKEYFSLNTLQLRYLNLTIPVYLSQYGSYFAIIKCITMDDNICEVELIKI